MPDEAAPAKAVWHRRLKVAFKADGLARRAVRWPVPAKEGVYCSAAVVRRKGDKPVVSQRAARATAPAITAGAAPKGPGLKKLLCRRRAGD